MKEPLSNLLDLQREYQRLIQRLAKKHNLTLAEWQLLQKIVNGKDTQELLADAMQLDISTLSRQLGRLTTKEFVIITKVNSQTNVKTRKSYRYQLSESGQKVLSQMNTDFSKFNQKVFAQWSSQEKKLFKETITHLIQSMQSIK